MVTNFKNITTKEIEIDTAFGIIFEIAFGGITSFFQ
tara:strand:- start:161 stop:268 length:108 start_codon:yes stop_codon:yes gene_type:complete